MALYPSVYSSFTDPLPTNRLNSPSHSSIETAQNTGIEQLEFTVGNRSSALGTIWYDLRATASNGGGHVQTANKGGTGQTVYTKGDLLVGQSSSVLVKLAVGPDGAVLQANSSVASGVTWKIGQVTISSFLSSATWTKPNGLSFAEVHTWGGGGSGGTASIVGGGGGGGGSHVWGIYATSLLGLTEAINIGAGGASVAAQNNGNVGGNTVFGTASLLVAYGGGRGGGNTSGPRGGGGAGMLGVGGGASGQSFGIGGAPNVVPSALAGLMAGGGGNGLDGDSGGGWGGGGGIQTGGWAVHGGAGGGAATSGPGGSVLYGGGGGGAGTAGGGGPSRFGGRGGDGGSTGSAGQQPAGGGGGGTTTSGKGGDGKVIIYEFY